MSKLFISHSSRNNLEAVAIRDWLREQGWDEIFLDIDPERGIAAGQRWRDALNRAARRCEAVICLVSHDWLAAAECRRELALADKLNKTLICVLIEDLPLETLPQLVTDTWQVINLARGRDHEMRTVITAGSHDRQAVTFSREGLIQLRNGLRQAGLDPGFFNWPPARHPDRAPYPGLKPLEAEDAGIFYGRDASIVEALDRLRALRAGSGPRLFCILGASGAGKSSFLRAGLWPRLERDDRNFLPLPVLRPEQAAISGRSGLLTVLEAACIARSILRSRAELRTALATGAAGLRPILLDLIASVTATLVDPTRPPPLLVLSLDQGEELFGREGTRESGKLLEIIRELLCEDQPAVAVVMTIRSDTFERLQLAPEVEGIAPQTMTFGPMPRGMYASVIEGPATRLRETDRPLAIDPALTRALLDDMEEGGKNDALPLLAFTLERLWCECGGKRQFTLADYKDLGGIRGTIEAAVERALAATDRNDGLPRERETRLALLRHGMIPWLVGIDPDTGNCRRRVARRFEIPEDARPIIDLLVEERLLASDVDAATGEGTVEPAHEALLRQWSTLRRWVEEDAVALTTLESVRRAAKDWIDHDRSETWLMHKNERLVYISSLLQRNDTRHVIGPDGKDYLAACALLERRNAQSNSRSRSVISALAGVMFLSGLGWYFQSNIGSVFNAFFVEWPYIRREIAPYSLDTSAEKALRPLDIFKECLRDCPEMVAIPPGEFLRGSDITESDHVSDEGPIAKVTLSAPFAVSRYAITFDEYDACVAVGGCERTSASGFGRGRHPVINVNWYQAVRYAEWLSAATRHPYRLLTEAEWEYVARAGSRSPFVFGDDPASLDEHVWYAENANFHTHLVGEKKGNAFGLYDVLGNVWQWVQDCYAESYAPAPRDGSASRERCDGDRRVARGGSWDSSPSNLRVAKRGWFAADRQSQTLGFRLARALSR